MIGRMGFEQNRRLTTTGYGKSGWFSISEDSARPLTNLKDKRFIRIVDGITELWTDSGAERTWITQVEIAIRGGEIIQWCWQPGDIAIPYRYAHGGRERTYRLDGWINWKIDGEFWYEIKYGRIEQKAGNNIKRFCQAYPDRRMVLVWKGPPPKRGPTKRQWDKIIPWLHQRNGVPHIWYLK
jgi:hypothetical protein